jgi:alpha-galactosidase
MAPGLAYYGDHVELTDGGTDFASQIGTGSVIGTKFTYPKDNPYNPDPTSYLLTPEKEQLIRKWMKIYKENNLSRGEYLNLYTWGYDYPEAHVIRQNDAMYYSFYSDNKPFNGTIELRGLEKGATYKAVEYAADEPREFIVSGDKPQIKANFERNYLLKLTKNN